MSCACAWRPTAPRPTTCSTALGEFGPVSEQQTAGPNLRARVRLDGDLGELTDRSSRCPHAEVFSIGRAMEIVKEVGDVRRRRAAGAVRRLRGQPRHRPHADGHRVARRRRPLPPVLGAAVRRHLRRPQRPHHQLPQAPPQAREARATASPPATTPRRSPSTSPTSWRPASRLEDALRASVHDLDGTFAYLISTRRRASACARDRFALKPLLVAENDEMVLLASEEIALRTVVRRRAI